jgi:uncharacterized membrane protein YhaH (DUF805 family)
MNAALVNPLDWRGTLGRGAYAAWGACLFAAKFALDRFLVAEFLGKPFSPRHYWIPGDLLGPLARPSAWSAGGAVLLAATLPFLWMGLSLTARRLRSAGQPLLFVLLFFLPAVNLLFFLLLCVLPQRTREERGAREPSFLRLLLPKSRAGNALAAAILTMAPVTALVWAGTKWLGEYGWGLFLGVPFVLGFLSSLLHGLHGPQSLRSCFGVAMLSLLFTCGLLVVIAAEGAICLLMAAPLALPIALLGALFGRAFHGTPARNGLLALLVGLPLLLGAERAEPELIEVRSALEIDAPPGVVWRNVVAFAELPPPEELLFRTGLAYPIRAEIRGSGVGAVRHCVFSTGPFVEPIETWDEPRCLAFSVVDQPAPMHEWSPWPGLRPPHVDGYFVSRRGRFLLEPLPGGRTRLEGATWYTHRIEPAAYWKLWSDAIIHRIHLRVLRHVKRLSEERP